MRGYRLFLDNGREMDIAAESIDDATMAALKQYPEASVLGFRIIELQEELEEVDEDGDNGDNGEDTPPAGASDLG